MLEYCINAFMLVKVNEIDNVAIAVHESGIQAGCEIKELGLMPVEDIPQGHKIALTEILKNEPIIRYGEVIGYAKIDIKKGGWVSEDRVNLPKPPQLNELPMPKKERTEEVVLTDKTFLGYKNPDGTVGTKNMLGIVTTVQCVEGVLNIAVKKIKEELLPKYKNVDGVAAINHKYGCGVAINATNAHIPIRTIKNIANHPNFGGRAIVVGLGCEKLKPETVCGAIQNHSLVVLQDNTSFNDMVDTIYNRAKEYLEILNKRKREPINISELVVGVQCGGSDAFSGVTANPAIGYAADLLVKAGATVMFSEVTEARDGVHLLSSRCKNEDVANKLRDEMAWYDKYLDDGGVDRDANPTPGNKKGGLANVVEKALGSIAKSGTSIISDVLSPGEKVKTKGLIYAATPSSDFVCGTQQLASGMTVQVFSTGRGTPYGLAMAPVVKVSSRSTLQENWSDLIDVDAGKIALGEATIEDVGTEIFNFIIDVASGKKLTRADYWKIENALCIFNPAPIT